MKQNIWNKEQGPTGETGATGPQGEAWDGQTPLSELTITNIASFLSSAITLTKRTSIITGTEALAYGATLDIESTNSLGTYLAITETGTKRWVIGIDNGSTVLKIRENDSSGTSIIEFSGSSVTMNKPLSVLPNTDAVTTLGRGKLGLASGGGTDSFYISHYDVFNSTNYSFRLFGSGGVGYTFINASSSGTVNIKNNNVDVATFSGSAVTMSQPLSVLPNTDSTTILGRAKIFGLSDVAYFSHYDTADTNGYALRQLNVGATYVNAKSGYAVAIRNNNSNVAEFSGTGVTMSQPLSVLANKEATTTLGRGKLGFISGGTDQFYISHYDHHTTSNYAIRILSTGAPIFNSGPGLNVAIRNNNVNVATFSDSIVTINKPLTITNQSTPSTPSDGGTIYVEGGALKYIGSSGTITTIANA
jgi:hypothetical protein